MLATIVSSSKVFFSWDSGKNTWYLWWRRLHQETWGMEIFPTTVICSHRKYGRHTWIHAVVLSKSPPLSWFLAQNFRGPHKCMHNTSLHGYVFLPVLRIFLMLTRSWFCFWSLFTKSLTWVCCLMSNSLIPDGRLDPLVLGRVALVDRADSVRLKSKVSWNYYLS